MELGAHRVKTKTGQKIGYQRLLHVSPNGKYYWVSSKGNKVYVPAAHVEKHFRAKAQLRRLK